MYLSETRKYQKRKNNAEKFFSSFCSSRDDLLTFESYRVLSIRRERDPDNLIFSMSSLIIRDPSAAAVVAVFVFGVIVVVVIVVAVVVVVAAVVVVIVVAVVVVVATVVVVVVDVVVLVVTALSFDE